jgi:hypothetical protein
VEAVDRATTVEAVEGVAAVEAVEGAAIDAIATAVEARVFWGGRGDG